MSIRYILYGILAISLLAVGVLYSTSQWIRRRDNAAGILLPSEGGGSVEQKQYFRRFLQKAYVRAVQTPLLSSYVLKMRRRISLVHPYDEISLRYETMKITLLVSSIAAASGLLLIWINPGITFILMALLAALVIQSLLVDMFMNRLERKLLVQSLELFSGIRHYYQQHGMVEEAIYEGTEGAGPEISVHAHRIYQALVSRDPEEQLERFYETAPNRFLKAFAGISHLVSEFGDRGDQNGSIFLQGISGLTKEIHLEILRRDKLDYLLKGLNVIALVPVFFTKPVEWWARSSFPAMDAFYMSKLGIMTKLSIYLIILVAYSLLQRLQDNGQSQGRADSNRFAWEAALCRLKPVQAAVTILLPQRGTPKHERRVRLLKESNAKLTLEWFYVRRTVLGVLSFTVVLAAAVLLHMHARQQLLYSPVPAAEGIMFGRMSALQEREARINAYEDRRIMDQLGMERQSGPERIHEAVRHAWEGKLTREQIELRAQRIYNKWKQYQTEYLKWWEVLSAVAAWLAGYYFPLWSLYFNRKVRRLEMKHEVYQYHTVISILRGMDRMTVEGLLEWLNRFAVIFKIPIQKCLLHYEHGAERALETLKDDVRFPEFQRLVDKLMLASDKVPLREVFDDLEGEMAFVFEQRRQEYEKMVDTQAGWGRLIGFAPMYGLIFLYLVIPLILMSFTQMSQYYDQIQKL